MKERRRPLRRARQSFSGSIIGVCWSFAFWRRGAVWGEACDDDLPERVGTQGIVLPSPRMGLTFDFEHLYLTGADNRPATCRIRVYSPVETMLTHLRQHLPDLIAPVTYSSQEPTVILCEPIAIGGITNRAEEIATAVWHQLGRPRQLTWCN